MSSNNYRNDRNDSMSSSSYRGGGSSHHQRDNQRDNQRDHRDNHRDNQRDRRGGGGGGGGGGSRRGGRQPSNISSLPFEQGIICSLKESFGFIHCAERPEEIFFHYSEVTNCHPDDLKIDTEVEFKVGTSAKLAAFSVKTLEQGTVVWETEEEEGCFYKGLVEKQCVLPSSRSSDRDRDGGRSNNGQTDGTIRIIVEEDTNSSSVDSKDDGGDNDNDNDQTENENENKEVTNDGKNNKNKKNKNKKNGPIVRLRAGEYSGAKRETIESSINSSVNSSVNSSNSKRDSNNKLFRGDLVEFRVFLDRRTKQKYARQITLLQSDRERKRTEKDKKLLESATAEEGIVVALNNGFGFINSNKRREDIYFHYSQLVIPDAEGNSDDFELKKGQEVKFLVVTEVQPERQNNNSSSKSISSNNNNGKISARQIHCLPKGTVVFHTVEAKGVKGMVTMIPHPPSPGSKTNDSKMGPRPVTERNGTTPNETKACNRNRQNDTQ